MLSQATTMVPSRILIHPQHHAPSRPAPILYPVLSRVFGPPRASSMNSSAHRCSVTALRRSHDLGLCLEELLEVQHENSVIVCQLFGRAQGRDVSQRPLQDRSCPKVLLTRTER
jgi:hypothetical protein